MPKTSSIILAIMGIIQIYFNKLLPTCFTYPYVDSTKVQSIAKILPSLTVRILFLCSHSCFWFNPSMRTQQASWLNTWSTKLLSNVSELGLKEKSSKVLLNVLRQQGHFWINCKTEEVGELSHCQFLLSIHWFRLFKIWFLPCDWRLLQKLPSNKDMQSNNKQNKCVDTHTHL